MRDETKVAYSIKSLLSQGSMQGMIEAERKKMQEEEAKLRAIAVAKRVQLYVDALRAARAKEKIAKSQLKRVMEAVELYDSSGDISVLQKVGLV